MNAQLKDFLLNQGRDKEGNPGVQTQSRMAVVQSSALDIFNALLGVD